MAGSAIRSIARAFIAPLALVALVTPLSTTPVRATVTADSQCTAAATDPADTTAPTQPTDFRVVSRAKSGAITLGWVASYDAVGVAGYKFYKNGIWSGTLCQAGVDLIGTVMYDRLGGRTKTAVTYQVYAFDGNGNVSTPATLVVEADDYDRALAFYRDALGLREELAVSGDDDARVTILAAGRATLELANPAQKRFIDEVEVGRQVAPRLRVAFEVADADAATDALVAAGAELIAPATETPWRSRNARLAGPADLQITLFQELDGSDA